MSDRVLDIVITCGRIADGTGQPAFDADIGIIGDRIAVVGDCTGHPRREVIDARGLVVSPGFIDTHTHDDRALVVDPALPPKLSQGVTTVIAGNCGVSLAPGVLTDPVAPLTALGGPSAFSYPAFASYLEAVRAAKPAVNAAFLVGHNTLRVRHVADLSREASDLEVEAMRRDVEAALDAGAIGLSTGTYYAPGAAATPAEIAPLLSIVAQAGGVYAAHIRDEGDAVEAALDEVFDAGRSAGLPVIVSHHKVAGPRNFGRSKATLARITRAATGMEVAFDVYPYAASSTVLNRASWSAATRTVVSWSEPYPQAAGRDLADVAGELGIGEEDAIDRLSPGGGIYFMMDEADVERILSHPLAMIGSDGLPHDVFPHPRLWGSFTRVLGHYRRTRGLFRLEEAVRRMTSLPASVFRLEDRGVIAPGAYADLVVFDPDTVGDEATYGDPKRPSAGIQMVLVNGAVAWRTGGATGARAGRVLSRAEGAATRRAA